MIKIYGKGKTLSVGFLHWPRPSPDGSGYPFERPPEAQKIIANSRIRLLKMLNSDENGNR